MLNVTLIRRKKVSGGDRGCKRVYLLTLKEEASFMSMKVSGKYRNNRLQR